jgi:hypothetical protein
MLSQSAPSPPWAASSRALATVLAPGSARAYALAELAQKAPATADRIEAMPQAIPARHAARQAG